MPMIKNTNLGTLNSIFISALHNLVYTHVTYVHKVCATNVEVRIMFGVVTRVSVNVSHRNV